MGSPCSYFDNGCNITTDEAFANYATNGSIVFPTDYYPHYSDGAFAILARALEGPAGITWEDFLDQMVFPILNMTNTGYSYSTEIIKEFAPPLYSSFIVPDSLAFIDMDWSRPTGGMYSSANDLLKFASLFLTADTPNPAQKILTPGSIREMLLPSFINDDQSSGFGFPFEWFFAPKSQMWMITKGGSFPGYTANIALVPKMNFGCVSLSNNLIGSEICTFLTDYILPTIQDYLVKKDPPPPNPGNLTAFVGTYYYSYPEYATILNENVSIFLDPSGEFLWAGTDFDGSSEGAVPLKWIQGNTFQELPPVDPPQPCIEVEISFYNYINFQTNFQGEVVSFQEDGSDPFWGSYFMKQF